jgi:N-acetylneuraminic acid mutarotase
MPAMPNVALCTIGLLLAACTTNALRTGGHWDTVAPMHHARAAHAVVTTSDAIYALAGTGDGGAPVLAIERFDGVSWRDESTLPGSGLNAPAAAVLGEQVYLTGGFNTTTNVPTADVHVYDVRTRQWRRAAPLPAPRGGHAAVVLNGAIHVIGGGNDRSTLADHDAYDPATGTWRSLAPLPRAEGSPAAAVIDGKLYAVGGRSGPSDFGDVYIYDPALNRWTSGPSITPRGTAGAVVRCGAIELFGGESQARRASLGEALQLKPGGTWTPLPPMPTPRNFARAVVLHGAVYVVGGSPTPEPSHASAGSAIVERFVDDCTARLAGGRATG